MRKLSLGAVAVASSLALAACGAGGTSSAPETTETATEAAGAFPATITHNAGETTIESQPKSIVVLDMAALDTIDALGAGDLVTGVPVKSVPTWLKDDQGTDYSTLENVGTLKEPDVEAIAKLNPDLVVVGARSAKFYDELSKNFTTIDASVPWDKDGYSQRAAESVEMLATAVGKGERGAELKDELLAKIAEYKAEAEKSERGTAMVLMTNGGEVSMHGPQSRWAPIYDVFGFKPVTEGEAEEGHKGQKISFETVRELAPDYIFVIDRDAAIGNTEAGTTAQQVLDNDLVNETPAAKNGHIVYLSPERWYVVMTGASNFMAELEELAASTK